MDPLNNLRNLDGNFSIALENPRTRAWFEKVVALLQKLPQDGGVASAEDLKSHVLEIKKVIPRGSSRELSPAASRRIDALFHQVFSRDEPLGHLAKARELFESGSFQSLVPLAANAKYKMNAFDKAFIRKMIVPKMFQEYPQVEEFGKVPAVANLVVNILARTTSRFELDRLKDRVDGIPFEATVNKVAIRTLLLKNLHGVLS